MKSPQLFKVLSLSAFLIVGILFFSKTASASLIYNQTIDMDEMPPDSQAQDDAIATTTAYYTTSGNYWWRTSLNQSLLSTNDVEKIEVYFYARWNSGFCRVLNNVHLTGSYIWDSSWGSNTLEFTTSTLPAGGATCGNYYVATYEPTGDDYVNIQQLTDGFNIYFASADYIDRLGLGGYYDDGQRIHKIKIYDQYNYSVNTNLDPNFYIDYPQTNTANYYYLRNSDDWVFRLRWQNEFEKNKFYYVFYKNDNVQQTGWFSEDESTLVSNSLIFPNVEASSTPITYRLIIDEVSEALNASSTLTTRWINEQFIVQGSDDPDLPLPTLDENYGDGEGIWNWGVLDSVSDWGAENFESLFTNGILAIPPFSYFKQIKDAFLAISTSTASSFPTYYLEPISSTSPVFSEQIMLFGTTTIDKYLSDENRNNMRQILLIMLYVVFLIRNFNRLRYNI